MDNSSFSELVLKRGQAQGLQDAEVYIEEKQTISIKAFKGCLEKYTVSNERVLSLRGMFAGKMGYSYTEMLEPELVDKLIADVIESAKNNDSGDIESIQDNSHVYKSIFTSDNNLSNISPEEKIQLVLTMEKEALLLDERVQAVDYCVYDEECKNFFLKNSRELELNSTYSTATAILSVVVQEGSDIKTGFSSYSGSHFSEFDPKTLAKDAVGDALAMLKSRSVKHGKYEVIIRNNVAAAMLEGFAPIFHADRVQKNLSILKGKMGSKIACSEIELLDDPLMANGARSRAFDDEATPAERKHIIKNGILETYLYNQKTAKKDNVSSTGNGLRTSHKTGVGIGPTNMYFAAGNTSLSDMIASVKHGIMIIDIQGTHAGINALSGDFSLSSYGYLIEEGTIVSPVNQITISGNFCSMLEDIEMVGEDIRFTVPNIGYFGSPSLKVSRLAIAGE